MRHKFPSCFNVTLPLLKMVFLLAGVTLSTLCSADSKDFEDMNAHYQVTFNWQRHPAFQSPYSAVNSLTAGEDKMYTFSFTPHLGIRPWQGGELYFDPEINSGVPFTQSLIGSGGFTNGEITRAGGDTPTLYRQRLFLRQTWNHGGGSEKVESGLNQLAGAVEKNRFVLTAGNFSTLDVFDGNTYAKDPRTQFMNWGNWTYAAYDYAADARGFGWGAAWEWYRDEWVFRLARMTGPKNPNELEVDFALLTHYGDQLEVEHAHTFAGQPGKIRVLGWRNRAKLATFSDALDYLKAHPGADPQTIFAARTTEQIKSGIGFNVEQAINENAGLFLRVMQADGRTETHAFTEVDGSFSAGVAIKGVAWGRAEDTIGLSLMSNTLSDDRRRFLEAGGISYFIGDGKLNYRPENIFEGYYSLNVYKETWLTADYQRIENPAYNADRGPVNVFAFRFHSEF